MFINSLHHGASFLFGQNGRTTLPFILPLGSRHMKLPLGRNRLPFLNTSSVPRTLMLLMISSSVTRQCSQCSESSSLKPKRRVGTGRALTSSSNHDRRRGPFQAGQTLLWPISNSRENRPSCLSLRTTPSFPNTHHIPLFTQILLSTPLLIPYHPSLWTMIQG